MEFWKENCCTEIFPGGMVCHVALVTLWRTRDDVVLCHVCVTAIKNKGMNKRNSDPSFISIVVLKTGKMAQ